MRFHSLKRLSCSLTSNCSIVTPSAPAAPPLLFTFNHAAQISRLGISCDLPCNLGSLMRLLPIGWSHSSAWTAPPLRSPTHCDTQADHCYYGRVRQRTTHRYSPPRGFCRLEFSLSPPCRGAVSGAPSHVPYKSLDRAHAAYMPDTTWAVSGYPPDSSRDGRAASVSMSSHLISTRQRQRTFRSSLIFPGPHLTQSCHAFSTTLKTTVFIQRPSWWFEAFFRKTAPEGQTTSISHTAPQS